MNEDSENWQGYEWTALSVTTTGTLLVSVQETALLIALPEILTICRVGKAGEILKAINGLSNRS
jgi:hypothetical protein